MLKLKQLTLIPIFVGLIACGGGGGSGSNGISYSGKTTGATLNATNVPEYIAGAFDLSGASSVSVLGVETNNTPRAMIILQTLNQTGAQILAYEATPSVIGVRVDETEPCTVSGSSRLTGDVNETSGDFSGELTFNNCNEGGVVLTGAMSFSTSFDPITLELDAPLNASFTNLGASNNSGLSSTASGNMSCRFDEAPQAGAGQIFITIPNSLFCNQNFLLKDNVSDKVFRYNNFEVINIEESFGQTLVFKGQFFHPDHGFVNVSDGPNESANTSTRAVFLQLTGGTNPAFGSGMFTGANGSAAEIIVIDDFNYNLFLDTDGDGTFDAPILTPW